MRPDEKMRIEIDAALEKKRNQINDWEKDFLLNISKALSKCINNERFPAPSVKQKAMVRSILKRVETK